MRTHSVVFEIKGELTYPNKAQNIGGIQERLDYFPVLFHSF
jgi:hypothetical protein